MARRSSTRQSNAARPMADALDAVPARVRPTGEKNLGGRPTSLTEVTEDAIIQNLLNGNSAEAACALAGVSVSAFYVWMNRGKEARENLDQGIQIAETEEKFLRFMESSLDARAQAEARAVKIVMSAMHGGHVTSEEPLLDLDGQPLRDDDGSILYKRTMTPPDGRLALSYLQRARPKDWNVSPAALAARVEVTGEGGGPVKVEHSHEQVLSLAERLAEVKAQHEAPDDIQDAEVTEE